MRSMNSRLAIAPNDGLRRRVNARAGRRSVHKRPRKKRDSWVVNVRQVLGLDRAKEEEENKSDYDVHHRPASATASSCAGFSDMRFMLATPPMGIKVTSGVSMPKRRAMRMWPNSWRTTQTKISRLF